jgi:hypothetical protein
LLMVKPGGSGVGRSFHQANPPAVAARTSKVSTIHFLDLVFIPVP